MKRTLLVLSLMVSSLSYAAKENPYCRDFKNIQKLRLELSKHDVQRILPRAEWLDDSYRKEDRKDAAVTIGKTIVLVAIQRLSWFSYVIIPTRAEAATMTGYYSRNPENFSKFLDLKPDSACSYLRMADSDADRLRDITRDLWIQLDNAR